MPHMNLGDVRAQLKQARNTVATMEKLLSKTTPEALRGDLVMMLQRANQDLDWAMSSLRKSEVDQSFRQRYMPGGE